LLDEFESSPIRTLLTSRHRLFYVKDETILYGIIIDAGEKIMSDESKHPRRSAAFGMACAVAMVARAAVADTEDTPRLEEIVVTAEKRTEPAERTGNGQCHWGGRH
jgi:hypothetical protein